jgi:hypothetical protein
VSLGRRYPKVARLFNDFCFHTTLQLVREVASDLPRHHVRLVCIRDRLSGTGCSVAPMRLAAMALKAPHRMRAIKAFASLGFAGQLLRPVECMLLGC